MYGDCDMTYRHDTIVKNFALYLCTVTINFTKMVWITSDSWDAFNGFDHMWCFDIFIVLFS